MVVPHAVPLHPSFMIVELFTTAMVLIRLAGDLASTLGTALKKFQRLEKAFQ